MPMTMRSMEMTNAKATLDPKSLAMLLPKERREDDLKSEDLSDDDKWDAVNKYRNLQNERFTQIETL